MARIPRPDRRAPTLWPDIYDDETERAPRRRGRTRGDEAARAREALEAYECRLRRTVRGTRGDERLAAEEASDMVRQAVELVNEAERAIALSKPGELRRAASRVARASAVAMLDDPPLAGLLKTIARAK